MANVHLSVSMINKKNINEVFHELKNLIKHKNCIITKQELRNGAARKSQKEAKKLQCEAGITKRVKKITKWGKKYKVGHRKNCWQIHYLSRRNKKYSNFPLW